MARHLWLVGMMGSGKSSVGRMVAERLGLEFVDSDDVVAARAGSPIADFWHQQGEAAFRALEAETVSHLASGPDRVIATGGGVVLRTASVLQMRKSGLVVWLQAGVATLAERVASNSARRPLLGEDDPVATLRALLQDRSDAYRMASHGTIATDGLEPETVATRIEEMWNAY